MLGENAVANTIKRQGSPMWGCEGVRRQGERRNPPNIHQHIINFIPSPSGQRFRLT